MSFQIICLAILFMCVVSAAASVGPSEDDLSACEQNCGNIRVQYPFGFVKECSKDETYVLKCNHTSTPPALFLGNIKIVNISLINATATVQIDMGFSCYNKSGLSNNFTQYADLGTSPFLFSTRNTFFGIGCDTLALFSDKESIRFASGCMTFCSSNNINKLPNPINFTKELISCLGIGCCQTPVSHNLNTLSVVLDSLGNHSTQLKTNPCSFGFLADPTWYRDFSDFSLEDTPEKHESSQVVLDWAIRGDITCADQNDYICGNYTICTNSTNGPGYLCSCKDGFQGNPYVLTGCKDIDDCKTNPCKFGKCHNTRGRYICQCPFGKHGDGEHGCSINTVVKVLIGIGVGILIATSVLSQVWVYKKKIQERNYRKNGGLMKFSVKIFREAQLKKASNNFDARQLLGEGGNGWVYKGLLADMIEIAVKKSKVVDQDQIEQFLNEVDIVSKINHKNVVKLLGVCLETKVPMLVYEFVPNGTLHHHLHEYNSRILDSWHMCLKIASETARALDYMHSQADPPIIHRDVKPSNILLDVNFTAKVSDFGASKLIPLDRCIAPTRGQGTKGYLDPEYLQTGELTTKSDVYAFGVVIMELLCKQKPISQGKSGELISIIKIFTAAVEGNRLSEVLKVGDVNERETEQVHLLAKLAVKCVAMQSNDRPTMTEVAEELNGLSKEFSTHRVEVSSDDMVRLLDDQELVTICF